MALIPSLVLSLAVVAGAVCGAATLPLVLGHGAKMLNRSRLQTKVIGAGGDGAVGGGGASGVGDAANSGGAAGASGTVKLVIPAGLRRRGVLPLRPLAAQLLRIPWFRAKCECCAKTLGIKGQAVEPAIVCELLLLASCLIAVLVFVLTGMLVTALCAAALAVGLAFGKAQKTLEGWEGRLVEQIPDALHSLGICFGAGYSLQQAFEQTALDTPDPLGGELKQASFDVRAGRSIEEALSALERRTKATDLRFAVIALEIQHRTGGSLQELLENAADAVIASIDLRRQLTVQTAQARLSARVVTLLPLVLVAVLSLAMEGYLQSFFSSAAGLSILCVALGMEAIGVLLIRRILGVNLG
jgi:tight adherence protein B